MATIPSAAGSRGARSEGQAGLLRTLEPRNFDLAFQCFEFLITCNQFRFKVFSEGGSKTIAISNIAIGFKNGGLAQEQLTEIVGTRQSLITQLENGTSVPSLSFLGRIAKVLDARIELHIVPRV